MDSGATSRAVRNSTSSRFRGRLCMSNLMVLGRQSFFSNFDLQIWFTSNTLFSGATATGTFALANMETHRGRGRPRKGKKVRGRRRPEKVTEICKPHFFKVMLTPTLRDGGFSIPMRFLREFGHLPSSPVELLAPGGGFWPVQLVTRGRQMWLGDGWRRFVEFHSIGFGHFLVFRYDGVSKFHVLILDTSATEVDYPKVFLPKKEVLRPKEEEFGEEEPAVFFTGQSSDHPKANEVGGCSKQESKRRVLPNQNMGARRGRGRPEKVHKPHFFKVMLHPTLQDNGLRIPRRFVSKFRHLLSSAVKLRVPGGAFWPVELVTRGGELLFGDGWQQFVEFHFIALEYFLVFRYEGKSKFHVLIFDKSTTEINYPKVIPEKEVMLPEGNLQRNELKEEEPSVVFLGESSANPQLQGVTGTKKNMGRSSRHAVKFLETKGRNPSFRLAMNLTSVARQGGHFPVATIPAAFGKKYLAKETLTITVGKRNGRKWAIRCVVGTNNGSKIWKFGAGWKAFVEDNDLKVGDACVFKLIKRVADVEPLLQVTILPASGRNKHVPN